MPENENPQEEQQEEPESLYENRTDDWLRGYLEGIKLFVGIPKDDWDKSMRKTLKSTKAEIRLIEEELSKRQRERFRGRASR